MVWILPVKRTSISKSQRFSKYKDVEESTFFILQKRKSSPTTNQQQSGSATTSTGTQPPTPSYAASTANNGGNGSVNSQNNSTLQQYGSDPVSSSPYPPGLPTTGSFNQSNPHHSLNLTSVPSNPSLNPVNSPSSSNSVNIGVNSVSSNISAPPAPLQVRPIWRIITRGVYPYYELAYGYSRDGVDIRSKEWSYITQTLPLLMPPGLNQKVRTKWILAHFTQLALENSQSAENTDELLRAQQAQEEQESSGDDDNNTHGNTRELDSSTAVSTTSPKHQPHSQSVGYPLNSIHVDNSVGRLRGSTGTSSQMNRNRFEEENQGRFHAGSDSSNSTDFNAVNGDNRSGHFKSASVNFNPSSPNQNSNHVNSQHSASTTPPDSQESTEYKKDTEEHTKFTGNPTHSRTGSTVYPLNSTSTGAASLSLTASVPHPSHQNLAKSSIPSGTAPIFSTTFPAVPSVAPTVRGRRTLDALLDGVSDSEESDEQFDHGEHFDEESEHDDYDYDHRDYDGDIQGRRMRKAAPRRSSRYSYPPYPSSYRTYARYSIARRRSDDASSNSSHSSSSALSHLSPSSPFYGYSSPLPLRGSRLFLLLVVLCNIFLLLVRDASLLSFFMYLILINTIACCCVLLGKPFSFAVLMQVPQQQPGSTKQSDPAVQQQVASTTSSNLTSVSILPSSSPATSTMSPIPEGSTGVDGSPIVSSSSRPLHIESADQSVSLNSDPIVSSSLVPAPIDSLVSSSSLSFPLVPSPFASALIHYDSGPWTVAPLPIFARGYVNKIPLGCTLSYSESPEPFTWCRTIAESFQVRIGPNYKKNKQKAPSPGSLYQAIGCDIFQCESKMDHIARMIKLPLPPEKLKKREHSAAITERKKKISASIAAMIAAAGGPTAAAAANDPNLTALLAELPDGDFEDSPDSGEYVPDDEDAAIGVPPLWIVNFQIPAYAPPVPMFGAAKEDGEGYSVVCYYRLTPQGILDLRHDATPAARLLKQFLISVADEKYHGRYKSIPKIINPDVCDVGRTVRQIMSSYNAKPFLTGPWCHAFIKGPGYVECDIDVHRFRYVARRGAHNFMDVLKTMIIDVAFVVEGQDDDELPEQIQGATRIHYPSPSEAKHITHYLKQVNSK